MVLRLGPWRLLSDAGFLDDLLFLFGYPVGSGQLLVDGSLRMRYCSVNFSCKKPTWRLPRSGGVAALVDVASVRVLVDSSSGSGDATGLGTLVTILERGYDLPKRLMFESGSGLILGNSQFPNVGGLAPCGMFAFLGVRVGFFALGLGSFMLMNLRELAEYQVAQSHASRRSACRLFALINA